MADEKAEAGKELVVAAKDKEAPIVLDSKGEKGKKDEKELQNIDPESTEKKLKYPRAIPFIISNEFCERFSFYGMRTILSIYLAERLLYSDDSAVVIYHVWSMLVYFFPIVGAIIADNWLGRFKTIFILSIVYACGSALLAITAIPPLGIPPRSFTIIGIIIVAIGSGGIKPNVAAFGGDQFILPQQESQLATFFSIFYFSINAGSFISTFITPILRQDVQCYDGDCYPLAFGVPGVLMVVSIVIFIVGKPLYIIKNPTGNVLVNVFKCISHALSRKGKLKKIEKREHWLEYADDKYSKDEISGIRAALKVLLIFVPLPIFWALFDQQGSRWTFQATRMDGSLGSSFIIKPDQMQVVNPLLILIFIPLFEVAIYPALRWCKLVTKPLHKMIGGGFLAALAFIISAVIELQLEKTYPVLPGNEQGHLRLYSGYDCDIGLTIFDEKFILNSTSLMYERKNIYVKGVREVPYEIETDCQNFEIPKKGKWRIEEGKELSYFLNKTLTPFEDDGDKSKKGLPFIRVLRNYNSPSSLYFEETSSSDRIEIQPGNITKVEMKPTTYTIYEGDKVIKEELVLGIGAVYTIIIKDRNGAYIVEEPIQISPPNSVHMLWLIPQYVIITMGEVMFSVTGLEFAFTQAPSSMKSVLTAGWYLTIAFGNLIVVIVAEAKGFDSQASEFFLFAGLMILDMIIFWAMTYNYEYVDINKKDEDTKEALPMADALEPKQGIDNQALESDEKPIDNK